MQFKKLDVGNVQSEVWWNTLKELAELNDWIDYDADREGNIDIAAVVESHNDLIEIYEHCKEVIEKIYGKEIANIPFLVIYSYGLGSAFEWDFINTEDDEGGRIKELLIEGAKYDGFDSFYLLKVPLTDSVKTQLDNFRWIQIGYTTIVTEYDEGLLLMVRLAAGNASDVKVLYTHKAD